MKALALIQEECAAQRERMILWAPALLSVGVGAYFMTPYEPPLWPFLCLTFGLLMLWLVFKARPGAGAVLLALFLISLGFAAGEARTFLVYTPILQKKLGPVEVTGIIEAVEELEEGRGKRLLLYDTAVEKLTPERTPVKIRLAVRKADDFAPGQRVKLLASLTPPSPPVAPGAFDFQRYLFFQRIGAVGFVYKKIDGGEPGSGSENFMEDLRNAIAARMKVVIDKPEAPMSIAFVTGQRAAISEDDNVAMQNSGLAHLISISGIHIALFSGFIFFTSRLLMACVPGWALKRPIKKYAAVLGFFGAVFYTVLAGSSIPTQRSLIMAGIAYIAIILDRSPISLRMLATAAFAVLLFTPESLISVSFQMSFAAVAALIVFFDALRGLWSKLYSHAGFFRRAFLYVASVCMTTIIANVATAPFSLFHFQQFTVYGVIANAAAVPLTTFIVMPAIVLALFAMPFGLEYFPLKILGFGMKAILWVAYHTAALPHATLNIAAWPQGALGFMAGGLVFILLWKGRLRVLGLLPLMISAIIIFNYKQPDILVSPDFGLMAYRAADGSLNVSGRRKGRFVLQNWERLAGLPQGSAKVWPAEGANNEMACDEGACRLELKDHKVSFLKEPESFAEECAWAELILSFEALKKARCETATVKNKFDGFHEGAHAAWLEPSGIQIMTVEEERGKRPWSGWNERK